MKPISRRDFLKLGGLALACLAFNPLVPGTNKKCPFCAWEELRLDIYKPYGDVNPQAIQYVVRCIHCGAQGPVAFDKKTAWKRWNTRPTSPYK
mgnify:CR=1 FL=1